MGMQRDKEVTLQDLADDYKLFKSKEWFLYGLLIESVEDCSPEEEGAEECVRVIRKGEERSSIYYGSWSLSRPHRAISK